MSYKTIAQIARDGDLQSRFIACASVEAIENASSWVGMNAWTLSVFPGLEEAYSKAVLSGDKNPGGNEEHVTDALILAAVQALRDAEKPPPGPEDPKDPA